MRGFCSANNKSLHNLRNNRRDKKYKHRHNYLWKIKQYDFLKKCIYLRKSENIKRRYKKYNDNKPPKNRPELISNPARLNTSPSPAPRRALSTLRDLII